MRATLYTMCMLKFTPLSISPCQHSMERQSLIFPAFLSLIILFFNIQKEFVEVPSFLMMFQCLQQDGGSCRLHAESLLRCVGLLTKRRPPQHRGDGVTQLCDGAHIPFSLTKTSKWLSFPSHQHTKTKWYKTKHFSFEKILPGERQTKHYFPFKKERKTKNTFLHPSFWGFHTVSPPEYVRSKQKSVHVTVKVTLGRI